MKTITKSVTVGAITALLLPTLAFAHSEGQQKSLEVRIQKGIERVERRNEHKDDRDDKREMRFQAYATTTAAKLSKQAARIELGATTMLSFNTRIQALIASSSDNQAELQAKYAAYTASATNAKTEAGKVIAAAAQVTASSSTTTNATVLASMKTDLREAQNFLGEAKKALFSLLRSLWD